MPLVGKNHKYRTASDLSREMHETNARTSLKAKWPKPKTLINARAQMAKSLRSKRKKRLRTLRREISEPFYEKKEAAKLAAQEAAIAAPRLPVKSPVAADEPAAETSAAIGESHRSPILAYRIISLPSGTRSCLLCFLLDRRECGSLSCLYCFRN